jgi:hypothetical protein
VRDVRSRFRDRGLGIPLSKVGSPIRKSADQSSFAAPRGLSQRSTSFIASQRQGIHQMPLRHLIALIINAHPSRRWPAANLRSPQRTVIRKTSLLHKIDPTALRSSFADGWGIRHQISGIGTLSRCPIPISRFPNGDSAPHAAHATRSARIDLLFTMSDSLRAIGTHPSTDNGQERAD